MSLDENTNFLSITSREIYWYDFGKKNLFFQTFYDLSSRDFSQKCEFLKNEKKIVKNLQKSTFFCSYVGAKGSVSTPRFWGTPV